MGFADALYALRHPVRVRRGGGVRRHARWSSCRYFAIEASSDLAAERGRYASYDGSLWSRGILPIDSVEMLADAPRRRPRPDRTAAAGLGRAARPRCCATGHAELQRDGDRADRDDLEHHAGSRQSIEPTYRNLFVKSNMSGDFTVVNEYLVARAQGARACGTR